MGLHQAARCVNINHPCNPLNSPTNTITKLMYPDCLVPNLPDPQLLTRMGYLHGAVVASSAFGELYALQWEKDDGERFLSSKMIKLHFHSFEFEVCFCVSVCVCARARVSGVACVGLHIKKQDAVSGRTHAQNTCAAKHPIKRLSKRYVA